VKLSRNTLKALLSKAIQRGPFDDVFETLREDDPLDDPEMRNKLLAWLVAGLCPTSHVTLKTQYCDQTVFLAVKANDWATVPDNQLLGRVGCADSTLFPLRSSDGELLGRIGIAYNALVGMPGAIAYQGVVCGRMKGLAGVALARANNDDARRVEALPAGSTAVWQAWADDVLKNALPLNLETKLRLHPLVPGRDLAVWKLGKDELTLVELVDLLSTKDEVLLHKGTISHDDSDDMSSDRFSGFKPLNHLVCLPSMSPRDSPWDGLPTSQGYDTFPWFLGVSPMHYQEQFERELTARWGAFEEDEQDEYVVGDVDGIEVMRLATPYRRSPPAA
jgi:hypothetical protein